MVNSTLNTLARPQTGHVAVQHRPLAPMPAAPTASLESAPTEARTLTSTTAVPALPRGWPAGLRASWAQLALPRAPRVLLLLGAEGGVGVSTVTALLAETTAASGSGPVVALDQCGSQWGALSRRLLDQRGGMPAEHADQLVGSGVHPEQVRAQAPRTSAGTILISDTDSYTPLNRLAWLVRMTGGLLVVDGGRVDALGLARIGPGVTPVVLGRPDLPGAEAICAAVTRLRSHHPLPPAVVIVATAPVDPRRQRAARRLLHAAGIPYPIAVDFDPRLAGGRSIRLDAVGKTTAGACVRLATHLARPLEAYGHGS